uniref:Uncharacterized protein n=1 Tax=Eptatretus burgeri TaxID=7764 RepID=A0A8C4N6J3_EPTBU
MNGKEVRMGECLSISVVGVGLSRHNCPRANHSFLGWVWLTVEFQVQSDKGALHVVQGSSSVHEVCRHAAALVIPVVCLLCGVGAGSVANPSFNVASFVGGMALIVALQGIAFFAYKFYKSRSSNYQHL